MRLVEPPSRPTSFRSALALFVLALAVGCADSSTESPVLPDEPLPGSTVTASFEIIGRILGPVQQDNASVMQITLRETAGVGAVLHWIRLECTNRSTQEWGAQSFVSELGSNHLGGGATLILERDYQCAVSARPASLTASLTDDTGVDHLVTGPAFHPDWPGS